MEALRRPIERSLLIDADKGPKLAKVQGINSYDSPSKNLLLGVKPRVN